jgi:hypothetical protein
VDVAESFCYSRKKGAGVQEGAALPASPAANFQLNVPLCYVVIEITHCALEFSSRS